MATCRDCALWDRERAMDKAGRIRKDRAALCLWKSTEKYPLSVKLPPRRAHAGHMAADDGKGCPRFIQRNVAVTTTKDQS